MSARGRLPTTLVVLAAVASTFLALPLVGMLARAPWSEIVDLVWDADVRRALVLSVVVSVLAAAVATILGVPLAWVISRTEFPGRRLVRALAIMPLVLPPVVGGVALLAAFGRTGIVGRPLDAFLGVTLPFTPAGAVVAASFVALPFVVLATESGLDSIDTRYEAAAATLGADRWTTFVRVTVPLVWPSIAAGALLAWARAVGEFGVTITFAGNVPGRTQTMPLAIFLALQDSPQQAIAVSLLLVFVALVVLLALRNVWLPSSAFRIRGSGSTP